MATLEKIRSRMGVLLAVIIGLSLLMFVLDDFIRSGNSLFQQNQNDAGSINGQSISYPEFDAEVEKLAAIYKQNNPNMEMDEKTMDGIRESIWNRFIMDNTITPEMKTLGMTITPEELIDVIENNSYVRQLFTDRQTGMFNKANLMNFIQNLDQVPEEQKKFWLSLEQDIENQHRQAKYNTLISKAVYVTKYQAEQRYTENNTRFSIDLVKLSIETISDSSLELSNSDYKAYYKEHKNEFKQTVDARDIIYLAWPIKASVDDDSAFFKEIIKLKDEFIATDDARQFVNLNSDTLYTDKNYNKGEIPVEINDYMFLEANPNDVFGPYFSNNTYALARLIKRHNVSDSVQARHILLQPSQTMSDERAKTLADSIFKVLKSNKAENFGVLAMQFSTDGSKEKGGDLGWFAEGAMIKEFSDSCFYNATGKIMLVKTQYGYHIIQVTNRTKPTEKVQVAILKREVIPSSKTRQSIYAKAVQYSTQNNTATLFEANATSSGIQLQVSTNTREDARAVNYITNAREMVRWVFNTAKVGQISAPMEIEDNYIVAALKESKEEGYIPLDKIKEQIKPNVMREKKLQMLTDKMNAAGTSDIQALAQKLSIEVMRADDIMFSSYGIPGAGIEPNVAAAISALKQGETSKVIKGTNGVFIAKVNTITPAEKKEEFSMEQYSIIEELKSRAGYDSYEALKKISKIVDRRAKFY